eukprot:scaffold1070_cov245-Pinguiococcus_pyrenoidosus.AAC.22
MTYHGFMLENNPNDFLEVDLYLTLYEDSPATRRVLRRSNLREGHNRYKASACPPQAGTKDRREAEMLLLRRFAIGGSLSAADDEDYTPVSDRMEDLMDLKYGRMSRVSRLYALILRVRVFADAPSRSSSSGIISFSAPSQEVLPLSRIYCSRAGDPEHPSLVKIIKLIEDDGVVLGDWNAPSTPDRTLQLDASLQQVRAYLRSELSMLINWMEEVADLYMLEKEHERREEKEEHRDEEMEVAP